MDLAKASRRDSKRTSKRTGRNNDQENKRLDKGHNRRDWKIARKNKDLFLELPIDNVTT